jgi:hypothetical protein
MPENTTGASSKKGAETSLSPSDLNIATYCPADARLTNSLQRDPCPNYQNL